MSLLNFEKIANLVSIASLLDKTVLQVGLGSGGAPVCDHLTMNGVSRWKLFDPDRLDDTNLVKHPRQRSDLGRFKVDIQRDWILDRNPNAEVTVYPEDVFGSGSFRTEAEKSSLLLCCADRHDVRLFVNDIARERRRPCITACVFRQGYAGEVYTFLPGKTGCFACMERAADEMGLNINDSIEPAPDEEHTIYGLNVREFVASGLSLDIHAISLLQARMALAILTAGASRQIASPRGNWLIYYNRPIPDVPESRFSKLLQFSVKPRKDCVCAGTEVSTAKQ